MPFTKAAVVMAMTFVASPLYVRQAVSAFEAVDSDLLGASRTLGAGPARTFFRVAIPVALSGLSAGAVLAWARALGEFGATILFAGSLAGGDARPRRLRSTSGSPRASTRRWRWARC